MTFSSRRIFILPFAFLSLTCLAAETDNYLTWTVQLKDSTDDLNHVIIKNIQLTLDDINERKSQTSCEQVTFEIAEKFKTAPGRKLFEDWAHEDLDEDKIYPSYDHYFRDSVMRETKRYYLHISGLAPTIQVNGVHLGVDKLCHFGSTGRRYLARYLKEKRKGNAEKEAVKSAIRLGLLNEKTVLGSWASGVFSYGDMEANYQGFLFYRKMCMDEGETYLKQGTDRKWSLKTKPDIRKYVNPYWDETFNPSYYRPGTWKGVARVIKKDYCPMRLEKHVQERISLYQNWVHQSFSLDYIKELKAINSKYAPKPEVVQSVDKLCEEQQHASVPGN